MRLADLGSVKGIGGGHFHSLRPGPCRRFFTTQSPAYYSLWKSRKITPFLSSTQQLQGTQTVFSTPLSKESPPTLTSTQPMIHTTLSQ